MDPTIIAALISGATSLFGGRKSGGGGTATPTQSMQPPVIPQQPNVTDEGGFLENAGKLLGNEMLSAVGSRITSKMRGQSTLRYNQAAFPGTNPWEHLGGGARGQELAQMASSQNTVKQAERASIRQSQTALGQTRMATLGSLANQIYANKGDAGLAMISRLLKQSGVLTGAGTNVQTGELADTHLQATIRGLGSQAALADVQRELAPYLALSGRISAGGKLGKEAKGIIDAYNQSDLKGTLLQFMRRLGGNNNAAIAPRIKNPLKLTIN